MMNDDDKCLSLFYSRNFLCVRMRFVEVVNLAKFMCLLLLSPSMALFQRLVPAIILLSSESEYNVVPQTKCVWFAIPSQ